MKGSRFDRLDVTPFIDVLLVLLILFMVAVPVPEKPLAGSLVGSEHGPGAAPARVRVEAEALWLDGDPQSGVEGLGAQLLERFRREGPGVVLIEARDGVAYERVVAAIDAAEGAGASRIGLVEQAPAGPGDPLLPAP